MPKFLEDDLRRQAAKKGLTGKRADHYVFGAMNNIGAMRGSKETAKGRAMEEKHDEDTHMPKMGNMGKKKMGNMGKVGKMREMRIQIHRGAQGKVSGFTVHHEMEPTATSKSGAFMEHQQISQPFSTKEHEAMIDHVHEHTAAQLGAAAGNAKESAAAGEQEGGEGGEYEES